MWCVRQIFQAPRSTNSSSGSTWAMPLSASLWCLMSVSSLMPFLPPTVFFSVIVFIILILVWRETSEVFNGGTPLCETSLPVFICSSGWPHSLGRGTLRVSEVQGCVPFLTCIALTIPLFCWKYYFECWKWLLSQSAEKHNQPWTARTLGRHFRSGVGWRNHWLKVFHSADGRDFQHCWPQGERVKVKFLVCFTCAHFQIFTLDHIFKSGIPLTPLNVRMPSSFLLSSPVFDTAYSPPLVLLSHEGLILLLLTQVLGKILNTKRTEIKNSSVQEINSNINTVPFCIRIEAKPLKCSPERCARERKCFLLQTSKNSPGVWDSCRPKLLFWPREDLNVDPSQHQSSTPHPLVIFSWLGGVLLCANKPERCRAFGWDRVNSLHRGSHNAVFWVFDEIVMITHQCF